MPRSTQAAAVRFHAVSGRLADPRAGRADEESKSRSSSGWLPAPWFRLLTDLASERCPFLLWTEQDDGDAEQKDCQRREGHRGRVVQ